MSVSSPNPPPFPMSTGTVTVGNLSKFLAASRERVAAGPASHEAVPTEAALRRLKRDSEVRYAPLDGLPYMLRSAPEPTHALEDGKGGGLRGGRVVARTISGVRDWLRLSFFMFHGL